MLAMALLDLLSEAEFIAAVKVLGNG